MQIAQNTIDDIVNRSDIVALISKELKLKRSGSNYFTCCPFHNEKTPSFSVNVNKQIFHCFGCGESGNAITFLMKYYGYGFVEAIRHLADLCGIYIPNEEIKLTKAQIIEQKKQKLSLNDVIQKATLFYKDNLRNSIIAQNYLSKRNLNKPIIEQFQLGYAPNSNTNLSQIFEDYNTNKLLIDSGLVKNNDNKCFDRFRDRIIFPIKNIKGEIIAFGGRLLYKGEPKYLNSPETIIFNKSQELYGLFEAQKDIRINNSVIVVEGYIDVISLVQAGIKNTVATMGTAITTEQITKLLKLSDEIYYCFDGDLAGQNAAWRALERSIPLINDNKTIYFLFLAENQDPDSFINANGSKRFIDLFKNNSLTLSAFLLNNLTKQVNLKSDEGKAKLINLVKPYIEQIKALALQVLLKKQLANLVELQPSVLESILNNRSRYAFFNSKWNNKQNKVTIKISDPTINTINLILKNSINNLAWIKNYKLPDDLTIFSPHIQELILLLDFLSNNYDHKNEIDLNQVQENITISTINFDKICSSQEEISLNEEEFIKILDRLFGYTKHRATKIPKIPIREINHDKYNT